jgi:2-dehydro-3-deoxygluconokinase
MRDLLPFADLFIGGREDAEAMLGIQGSPSLDELARQISQLFPRISRVAMTVREGISATHNNFGGLFFDKATDQVCHAPENGQLYPIANIVDRLGAGDAFTAGLIFALTNPDLDAPQSAIAFATAAGCLAHSIEGDFNFNSREEIAALVGGDSAGRVKR